MRRIVVLGLLLFGCEDPVISTEAALVPAKDDRIAEEPVAEPHTIATTRPTLLDHIEDHERRYDILPSAIQRGEVERARRRWTGEVQVSRTVLWNVPDETGLDATATGLLRISGTEVEWQSENDLVGVWQVAQAVRRRDCDRERTPEITECENDEETVLSALRRLSRHAMGVVPARRVRQEWIRAIGLSCDEPEGFPERRSWTARRRGNAPSLQESCQSIAETARGLVEGRIRRRVTGRATPVAWGGRCEREGGACDDPMACRRGLARIPNTGTQNALWCRPGSPGCPTWVEHDGVLYSDEVCARLQIPPARTPSPERIGRVESLEPAEDLREFIEDLDLGPLAAL